MIDPDGKRHVTLWMKHVKFRCGCRKLLDTVFVKQRDVIDEMCTFAERQSTETLDLVRLRQRDANPILK